MNRLYVDELISVGMVKAGDNPEAEVVIYKSHDTEMRPDQAPVSMMSGKAESLQDNTGAFMDLSAIESEDLRKSIEDALTERDERISALEKELNPPDPTAEAPDEVKAILKAQEDELAKLRGDLDAERQERRTAEFVAKAQPLVPLLGPADEIGPVLDQIQAAAPDAYTKLEGALTAAAQREDLAKLFSELGSGQGAESDPIAQRDAWVAKYMSEHDVAEPVARAEFWKANPDAVRESRS